MDIIDLLSFLEKPKLYEKGNAFMWTDPYIQKKLLKTHLDQNTDLASRKQNSIDHTISWIFSTKEGVDLSILDLGCGPGLYSEKMAKLGHNVIGVDISACSLEYAKKSAETKHLSIEYIHANYLELNFPNGLDLVDLIYCDFGVLSKTEQMEFLTKVLNSLKPDGVFVFDAYNLELKNTLTEKRDFFKEDSGFWRSHPYLCLSETFLYPEANAFLDQHVVIDDEIKVYRFYNHYYSEAKMKQTLKDIGFSEVIVEKDVISDSSITFYYCKK